LTAGFGGAILPHVSPQRNIRVVPHDPAWASAFREEEAVLRPVFGGIWVRAHHIGSTSIPGIPAKPIIDILLEVTSIEAVDPLNEKMAELGYRPKGEYGIPGRRYFPKGESDSRTHHLHVFGAGHPRVRDHLEFRDYLIAHPDEADEYGRLKERLAEEFRHDIEGYMAGKDGFIKDVIAKAGRRARGREKGPGR
jgi:GrpB-like predicted nucleotidyltransferase (UPF0157 family)